MKLASLLCFRSQAESTVDSMNMPRTPPSVACQYCGSVFRPGNHTTRLEPKMKINKKVRKLMARQQNGTTLGRFQQKVVTMYIASKNRVVKTCLVCNMSSAIDCKTRSTRSSRAPSRAPSHLSLSSIPTSDSSMSSGASRKLSKKQLRRLQQQQQQQLQQQPLNDSGLDVSISSSFLSTSSSTGDRSLSSVECTPLGAPKPKFTSTPIADPGRLRNFSSESFSHTVVAASAPAFKLPVFNIPAKSIQSKKKSKKDNKKGVLQKMLAQQKREKVNPQHSSTLAAFLSSL